MIERLLKEEEKAKVGRPKLADSNEVRKAKITLFLSLLSCFILGFVLVCIIKNESPIEYGYNLTIGKLTGNVNNKDTLNVKDYYDSNHDYIMDIKIPDSVDRYSGSYKYTIYYLKNNKWVKKETKEFERGKRRIKVKIVSEKNKNITWKIKFQIVNGSKIEKSYAPFLWKYVDAKENVDKYVYKIFTVKGYYSPVNLSEIKEFEKSKNKIGVYTLKEDARELRVSLPDGKYGIKIKYTDVSGKEVVIADDKEIEKEALYKIPNQERSTKVTIMVENDNNSKGNMEKKTLSNWTINKGKNGNYYATNHYILKPESSYNY